MLFTNRFRCDIAVNTAASTLPSNRTPALQSLSFVSAVIVIAVLMQPAPLGLLFASTVIVIAVPYSLLLTTTVYVEAAHLS